MRITLRIIWILKLSEWENLVIIGGLRMLITFYAPLW